MAKNDTAPEMAVPPKNCLNCRYVGPVTGGNVCRRKPGKPQVTLVQGLQGPQQAVQGIWLPVTQYDWCGKYAPKLQG